MTIDMQRRGGATALVAGTLLLAACGSATSSGSTTTTSSAKAAPAAASAPAGTAISTASGGHGTYLTGAAGRALYLWVADTAGQSACQGSCAQVWPPVIASGAPKASGGASGADLGTITRADGSQQVTYKGHPLYYFAADKAAGSTTGQGSDSFGAKWWLVSPTGAAITTAGSGTSTSGGKASYGGGWG